MSDPVDPSKQPGQANPPNSPDPSRTSFPTGEPGQLDSDVLRSAIAFARRSPTAPPPNLAPMSTPTSDGTTDPTAHTSFPTGEDLRLDPDVLGAAERFADQLPEEPAAPPPPPALGDGEDPSLPDAPGGPAPGTHLELGGATAGEPGPDDVQFTPPATSGDIPVTLPGGGEVIVEGPRTVRMAVPGGATDASVRAVFEEGARQAERQQGPWGWNVFAGLLGIAILAILALALLGGGLGGSPSPAPSEPLASGPGSSGGGTGAPAPTGQPSQVAGQSPAGPPAAVIIATNAITFGQATTFDPAATCKNGGTVTFTWKIAGIAANTTVQATLTGPGVESPVSFTASSDVPITKAFAFPPGGGRWSDTITSIGGAAPPPSDSSTSTVIQCSP